MKFHCTDTLRSIAPGLLLPMLVSTGSAQGSLSGSEEHIALAPITASGAEVMRSAEFEAHGVLGLPLLGGSAKSVSYVLVAGVATTPEQLSATAPLVFGTSPALVDAVPGPPAVSTQVFGFQLEDGSSTAAVLFAGVSALSVNVLSNTVIRADLPVGTNAFGNPLGAALVDVSNANGSGSREDAIVFTPALLERCPARVGQVLELQLHQPQGALYQVVLGGSIPGFALPIPPLAGALELVNNPIALTPFLLSPAGIDVVAIPIPDQANLIGLALQLQGVVLEGLAPLQGSFTNRLVVTIGP